MCAEIIIPLFICSGLGTSLYLAGWQSHLHPPPSTLLSPLETRCGWKPNTDLPGNVGQRVTWTCLTKSPLVFCELWRSISSWGTWLGWVTDKPYRENLPVRLVFLIAFEIGELSTECHTSDCITWPWHDRQIRLWLKCSYYSVRRVTACKLKWNVNWHCSTAAELIHTIVQRHVIQVWQPASHFTVYRPIGYVSSKSKPSAIGYDKFLLEITLDCLHLQGKPRNCTQHASLICRCADWFTYRTV